VSKKEDNAERKKRNREQQAEAGERFKRRVADPVKKAGKNVGRRVMRVQDAAINALGGAALVPAGAISGLTTGDYDDMRRGRRALGDAARSAKAVIMGEPEGEDILEGRVRRRGAEGPYSDGRPGMKKGGAVKSSASRRADGIAKKGKTRGKFV
jgi:hypothetical protein